MSNGSDLAKPGTILLLVGAILSAVGAVFMIMLAVGIGVLLEALDESGGGFVTWLYGVFALLLAVGTAFGFMAYAKAKEGDMARAFTFGLVAALMPPLQVIPLIGAIFCKVSEES